MIKLFISESAADKDLYDDLYSYADEYRMTSRWTKDNVEKYLKRQKNFRRMSDADFDKMVIPLIDYNIKIYKENIDNKE